jgi:hypothetical protein
MECHFMGAQRRQKPLTAGVQQCIKVHVVCSIFELTEYFYEVQELRVLRRLDRFSRQFLYCSTPNRFLSRTV